MVTAVRSLGLQGISGYEVTVECFLSGGLPAFDIVGLGDTAVKESRERVRAAVKNCGVKFPVSRITVNLAPAGRKKEGTLYDLPILLGILASAEEIKPPAKDAAFVGELSLTGTLRAVNGVLPMAMAAARAGVKTLYVPAANAAEATLADGLTVYGVENAPQLLRHLRGEETSTNPMATIFAWTGALRKRGQLDGLTELEQFADKLEQACFTTLNQGTMTKDLVGLVDEGVQAHAVTSAAFLAAVRGNLEASL